MSLVWADRVLETTVTTGTGDIALSGAVTGFRRFSAIPAIVVGSTAYVGRVAVDANGVPTGQWQTGLYTYSATNTLTLTTFEDSSTGSPISFAAGTQWVLLAPTAATQLSAFMLTLVGASSASALRTLIGAGTVTSVSVTTANGVSGSVATNTSTPAITVTLGAITPTTVVASGNITGANLSGTNTGDQTTVSGNAGTATALATGRTLSITGDLTWTSPSFDGTGNVTAAGTIPAGTITLAKQANMATASLVYRKTAGAGAPEVNTLATLKTDLGLTGTNSGDQTITLTGDATGSGTGSFATTLATVNSNVGSFTLASITVDAKGRITAASSGSGGTATLADGDYGDVVASSSGTVLTIDTAAVTLAKMANMATASVVYRKTAGSGAPEVNTLATLKTDLGLTGTNSGDQTITLTGDVTGSGTGSFAATIANSAVTLAKIANAAASSKLVGSGASGSGSAYAEITLGTNLSMSGTTLNASGGAGLTTTFTPQGRLTLVSATPVLVSDQTAKTTIYYALHTGDQIPLYSGSAWSSNTFTELSLALDTSNHLTGTLYDVFVWNNSGTISIGTGPAWINTATVTMSIATPAVVSWTAHGLVEGDPVVFTTSGALPTGITAGTTYYVSRSPGANSFNVSTSVANAAAGTLVATSGSQSGTHTATNGTRVRGTGAGTTELERKNGLWVNKNSITLKNGAGAGTAGIAADTALYVGTFYATANGQTGMAFRPTSAAGGGASILGLFNAYNRAPANAVVQDSTGSWNLGSSTWVPLDNGATGSGLNNRITYVDGLTEAVADSYVACITFQTSSAYSTIGVNRNSTNATPSFQAQGSLGNSALQQTLSIRTSFLPILGLSYIQAMNSNAGNAGTASFAGGTAEQLNVTVMM